MQLMRNKTLSTLLVLCLLPGLAVPSLAEVTRTDPAAGLPDGALAYVGWSKPVTAEVEVDWGETFGRLVTMFDPGAQGDPELAFVQQLLDWTKLGRATVGIALMKPLNDFDEPTVVVSVRDVDDPGELAAQLRDIFEFDDAVEFERASIEGETVQTAQFAAGGEVYWTADKQRLLVTLGDRTARLVMAEALHGREPLADNAGLVACRVALDAAEPAVIEGYLDLEWLFQKLRSEDANPDARAALQVFQGLGLAELTAGYVRIDPIPGDTRWLTRLFVPMPGDSRGLLTLWDQTPLIEADLQFVPADATFAFLSNWDLAASWRETQRTLDEHAPELLANLRAGVAMAHGVVGFDPLDDLLPALGDTWIWYSAPAHGGLLGTGVVLTVDVRDRETLEGIFGRLWQFAGGMLAMQGMQLVSRSTEHRSHEIHCAFVDGQPFGGALAACFYQDRLLLARSPQVLMLALDYLDGERGPALTVDADVLAKFRDVAGARQSLTFVDGRRRAAAAYPFAHGFSMMLATMVNTDEFNPMTLPTQPQYADTGKHGIGGWSRTDTGVLYTAHGVPVPMIGAGIESVVVIAALVSTLLPSLVFAREIAKRAVVRANLRGVGQACYLYANDHNNRFPPDLPTLLDTGLDRTVLQSPRQETYPSYVYIAGQTAGSDPRNVLAYELVLDEEGTAVLFVDGHVDWLRLDAFRRELKATYDRLGRSDEMPDAWWAR